MVAACLFLRTLVNLNRVDTGFNKENVLRLNIDSTITGYKDDDPRLTMLFKQIEERVNGLPGVRAASFSAFTFHEGSWNSSIRVPGIPMDSHVNVNHNAIGDAYFQVMQIPLLAGRSFGSQDTAKSQHVAIISEQMARHLFPAGSPIGRTYYIGSDDGTEPPQQEQVIGVAKMSSSEIWPSRSRISITFPTPKAHGALAISRCGIRETLALSPATCSRRFTPSIADCRSRTSRPSMNR